MKLRQMLMLVAVLAGIAIPLSAQNLKDDIQRNDLEGLKNKVALLEPDFRDFPYLGYYLKNAKEYRQAMLDYLLERGADVNQVDDAGVGPLYYAIKANNLPAVRSLIAKKADVNAPWLPCGDVEYPKFFRTRGTMGEFTYVPLSDSERRSGAIKLRPLFVALDAADPDIVSALLSAGADPLGETWRLRNTEKSTAKKTVYATNTVFDYAVGRFATSGGDLDSIDPAFFANANLLWQAVNRLPADKQPKLAPELTANIFACFATGNMKAFKAELVKTGANTLRFLPYAAIAGNGDIVDLILRYNQLGIDDPFTSDGGQNLLHWAITGLYTPAVRLLLDRGATLPTAKDITPRNRDSTYYPLDWAAANGKTELVKVLIAHGADVNDPSVPLSCAHASPEIRSTLIAAGADIHKAVRYRNEEDDRYRADLLFDAAWFGYPEAVSFYLSEGLSPDGVNPEMPPLLAAIHGGKPESVALLLQKGADPRTRCTNDYWFRYPNNRFLLQPARDWAAALADRANDPLEKARYAAMARALAKAEATTPARPVAPALVAIPGGTFTMGAADNRRNPKHEVTVSPFAVSRTISAGSYVNATGQVPDNAENLSDTASVTYREAALFCNALSQAEHLKSVYTIADGSGTVKVDWTANGYRLPTEAEWEYVARMETIPATLAPFIEDTWERCADPWIDQLGTASVTDPGRNYPESNRRVLKGANDPSQRNNHGDEGRYRFRVVRNLPPE